MFAVTNIPRCEFGAHSAMYIGTIVAAEPIPKPTTNRPINVTAILGDCK